MLSVLAHSSIRQYTLKSYRTVMPMSRIGRVHCGDVNNRKVTWSNVSLTATNPILNNARLIVIVKIHCQYSDRIVTPIIQTETLL